MKKLLLSVCLLLGFSPSFSMAPHPDPGILETLVGIHSDVSMKREARLLLGTGVVCAGAALASMGIQGNILAGSAFSFATLVAWHGAYAFNDEGEALERRKIRRLLNDPTNTYIPEESRPVLAKMCRQRAGASTTEYLCEAGAYEELGEWLKKNSEELRIQSPDIFSLLMRLLEIQADRSRALEMVLCHGADPNADTERALLYYSLPHHNYTQLLLQHGADPLEQRIVLGEGDPLRGNVFELLDRTPQPQNVSLIRANRRRICDGRDAYFRETKKHIDSYTAMVHMVLNKEKKEGFATSYISPEICFWIVKAGMRRSGGAQFSDKFKKWNAFKAATGLGRITAAVARD